jgi:hypothetical protein
MAKAQRKPFEVTPKGISLDDLAVEWCRDLDEALAARTASDIEVTYFHALYEQGRTRTASTAPWADAADLTSFLGTQYVDALRARMVKTVMGVEPVYTVEGWGPAEKNAPFVEEFHQWQLEAEGFQNAFSRAVHLALIEPIGWLETYEDTIKRPVRKRIHAKLRLAPDGTALVGEDLQPLLEMGPDGTYVQAQGEEPSAEVDIDSYECIARGPRHRTVAWRDLVTMPGHAKEKADIWGYAKRFYRRADELKERVQQGLYDKAAVEALSQNDEHASDTTLAGQPLGITAKATERAEKELWELLILKDLGEGLRWYVATLHKDTQRLLRLQYDDIGRPRYFPLVPFPRPNAIEGYSFIGHKLITVIEEHTAWRNASGDRRSLELQAPIKRKQGALWDPDEQPFGAKQVIDVREMDEVQAMDLPPASRVAGEEIDRVERNAERLAGITDVAAGVTSSEKRTLGEVNTTIEQSFVRMDEAIKNIQETLEEVAQVRHLMWKRALAELGDEGMPAPPSVTQALALRGTLQPGPSQPSGYGGGDYAPQATLGLEVRAPEVSGQLPNVRFTASMLEGVYRFKPRGSVETADRGKLRVDFNQMMQALGNYAAVNPYVRALLNTPQATKAILEQIVRLYHFQDKQSLIGSEVQAAAQRQLQQMMAPPMPPGGGPVGPGGAGSLPGAPPMAPPPGVQAA